MLVTNPKEEEEKKAEAEGGCHVIHSGDGCDDGGGDDGDGDGAEGGEHVAHSSMYDMIFVGVTKTKTKMTKTLKITLHSSGTTSASPGIHFTGSN